jgi:hypothetical protein
VELFNSICFFFFSNMFSPHTTVHQLLKKKKKAIVFNQEDRFKNGSFCHKRKSIIKVPALPSLIPFGNKLHVTYLSKNCSRCCPIVTTEYVNVPLQKHFFFPRPLHTYTTLTLVIPPVS